MAKVFSAEEVAKHNTADSCWVVIHGNVYDVTEFLPEHPGGSRIILQLAGRDATAEFDPIHPPGTLEENLKPEAKLGVVDPESLKQLQRQSGKGAAEESKPPPPPPLDTLLNLDDIEAAAKTQISKKCWAYYFSASDDLLSKTLNNTAYRSILLRPRVFVDVTRADTRTSLLSGALQLATPLYVSPAAMARLAHPDGEAGIARGVARFGALQIVSHNASMTPEQIVADAAPGQVFGWQLYVQTNRAKSEAMLARINRLRDRYKFVVLTLDAPVPSKREHDERAGIEARMVLEGSKPPGDLAGAGKSNNARPDADSGVGKQLFFGTAADLTWETTLPWLAAHTDLPIVLKGIQTHEDAYLAARWARAHPGSIRALILSNHGGRSLDTAPPAVHTLLEIRKYCPEVFDAVELWVDGGIRRGTDVVKALCLGAKAVGVGRAALWGLGAGGWRGVDRTFESESHPIPTARARARVCARIPSGWMRPG
ncbi:uncharacterized protein THITE_2112562 [Thermothielavioides terrestris NRRL 8126]|uniref:Uncharacterized protein n=1 Tax=Thermothielavioides terrestris (strain ATCC 38088 / NRRL 8126) TaxID=578455 RepID=G2QZH3_THETT|nr:uncharacterized protein THITE_2112562 [Thermothielavioides terrestris NRRL 8126]AEO65499.1 hypothetical protein THITE_2112562 [Thermothielavioides terrestris NRRL 8126]